MAAPDGENLLLLKKDPVDAVLYAIGMEKRKDGLVIAQKAHDHYFVSKENNDMVTQYGEVWNVILYSQFLHVLTCIFFI